MSCSIDNLKEKKNDTDPTGNYLWLLHFIIPWYLKGNWSWHFYLCEYLSPWCPNVAESNPFSARMAVWYYTSEKAHCTQENHNILGTSAKDSVQRQIREDRWFARLERCHVKMHPCTARRGWVGVLQYLMSYLQCRPDISTLAFRSTSSSHSDCDSQHQAGDSLSDLNSYLHWTNSRSNLGVAWHDKVKCRVYSHHTTTNEAIFKHLQTMRNNSLYWISSVCN